MSPHFVKSTFGIGESEQSKLMQKLSSTLESSPHVAVAAAEATWDASEVAVPRKPGRHCGASVPPARTRCNFLHDFFKRSDLVSEFIANVIAN